MPFVVAALRCVWLLLCCIACPAYATETAPPVEAAVISLERGQGLIPLGLSLQLLEDTTGRLGIGEVMSEAHAWRFKPSQEAIPGFGFSSSAFWARVRIRNAQDTDAVWWLEMAYAPAQFVDVYQTPADHSGTIEQVAVPMQILHWASGSAVAFADKPFGHRTHVFPLTVKAGETITLHVRIAGGTSKSLPLNLWTPEAFSRAAATELCVFGAYIGVLIGLALYNLLVYINLREIIYLTYVLFMAAFVIFFLGLTGLGRQYVWPDAPAGIIHVIPFSMLVAVAAGMRFTSDFLVLKVNAPRIHRMAQCCSGLGGLLAPVMWFLTYHHAIVMAVVLGAIAVLIAVYAGLTSLLRGVSHARYYLLAWTLLLIGALIQILASSGVIEAGLVSSYASFMGSALEAVLLSVALAARMRQLKEQNETTALALMQEKQTSLDIVTRYSHKLEEEVKSRTQELQQAQERMVAQEKMAALGVFTAGMAHEINNPANFVSVGVQNASAQLQDVRALFNDLLNDDADDEVASAFNGRFDKMAESLEVARTGISRIERIVSDLRGSQVEGSGVRSPVFLVTVLDDAVRQAIKNAPFRITFRRIIDCEPVIDGVAYELHKALGAILLNAVHALEDARHTLGPEHELQLNIGCFRDGPVAVLMIGDSGPGMRPDLVDRIFDPFFTTKPVGKGAGLGLTTAREIIVKHGGTIDALSVPGKGATFLIRLPCTPSGPGQQP